jgi:betaine-aldehyde dehydrogenase
MGPASAIQNRSAFDPFTGRLLIGGAWRDGADHYERISPATGQVVSHIALGTAADADLAVTAAQAAHASRVWAGATGADRASVLRKIADGIRARLDELALWETLEAGKPISQSKAEVAGAADHFDYASGLARTLHGDTLNNQGDGAIGLITRDPIGVVGLITPWNFPIIILSERLAYMLAAGNSVVVKPSEFTSTTTLKVAEIALAAGLPEGVLNVVTGLGEPVGQAIAAHAAVGMISFTGSQRAGAEVLRASAGNFKKTALELGGKNPQIVFADADLEDAADGVAFGLAFNAGQCCVSGTRILVESSALNDFAALLADKLQKVRTGSCLDPETQIGGIVTDAHRDKIMGAVADARGSGAREYVAAEGFSVDGGRFVSPGLVSGLPSEHPFNQGEIFGPVGGLLPFESFDEAIALANGTPYGLGASIWSKNIDRALMAMRRVEAGRTWINTTIAGGPEMPIGGYKASGMGRECGMQGIEEYTELKGTFVALGAREHWVR